MNEATRPVKGRGTVLSAVAFAAAMVACLAFAPLASAAETPVAAGSKTTITLNSGLSKKLKKSGVKVKAISPTTVSGKTVTLPINTLSTFDPVSGQGKLLHEGGIKFKKGKKSANVTDIELITAESKLTAKVGGKAMKFASVSGVSSVRSGFGATVTISAIKLTGNAAKQLNKKLGFTAKKKAKKSGASASAKKKKKKKKKKVQAPFKGNQVFGKASTTPEPKTISVKAGGTVDLLTSESTVKKFVLPPGTTNPETNGYFVKIEPISPTEKVENANPFTPTLKFPIVGGSIAPNASAGLVDSAGGVNLVQTLQVAPGVFKSTTITLGNLSVDLQTKKAIAEVVVNSEISPKLNLGSFGRTSIADINMTGATITSDPAAHTVTVSNATATLQETTAEVLNQVFGGPYDAQEPPVPHPTFAAGDPLGTFSFTATTE